MKDIASDSSPYRMIGLCSPVHLLSTEKDFVQFFRAVLPVFLFQSRSLQAEEFRPRIRIGRGIQCRFLTFEFLTQDILHEFRRRFPLVLIGHISILQCLHLNHSLLEEVSASTHILLVVMIITSESSALVSQRCRERHA